MKNKLVKKSYVIRLGFLLPFLFILCSIGCKKELETKVFGSITPDTFFKSEGDFNAAVVALYNPFTLDWGTSDPGANRWYASLYNANSRTYAMTGEFVTDELYNDWDASILDFSWGASTWGEGSTYPKIRYVARATEVIDKISKSTATTDAIRKKYVAEAKTMRAWLMYVLYDFYGPVNAKTDPASLGDSTILPRPTTTEYSAHIEKDLKEAIPDLPAKYNGDVANWGPVSQGVAKMLLLKLYMHNKEWAKAEVIGKEIQLLGYSLLPIYKNVFINKGNSELIYAIPSSPAQPNWFMQHLFPGDFKQAGSLVRSGGWYGYSMPWSFYDKFTSDDTRKSVIIDTYINNSNQIVNRSTPTFRGPIPLKYTGISGEGPSYSVDWVVFRFADVLLSIAEAINEQRGPADAYSFVNQVRQRAGVPAFSGMTKEQLRDALLEERGRELFCEGVRRQDLIRHGKFVSSAVTRGIANAASKHQLFPIPAEVIIESRGVVVQNPGY